MKAIPRWLARSRSLHDACLEVIQETRIPKTSPLLNLCRAKDIIRRAAFVALQRTRDGSADSLEKKIYWSLVLLRVARRPLSPSGSRAIRVYAKLQDFVDDLCVDVRGLHSHISDLIIERSNNLLQHEAESIGQSFPDPHRANALASWVSLWASKRRKICSLAIESPDGIPASSPMQSATYLKQWCDEVFSSKDVNLHTASFMLSPFIQSCPNDINWDFSYDEFLEMIISRRDTGYGPDGFVYSVWSTVPEPISRTIFDFYESIKSDGEFNSDFNDSRVVFPAKGKEVGDFSSNFSRYPSKTRPISLSNTDNKHIAAMIARPLTVLGQATVSSIRAGGLPGRCMGDHIINLECKAIEYCLTHSLFSGIISLDQAAACPTLSRKFLFWILRKMFVPRRIRRVVRRLYTGGKNGISIGGRIYAFFCSSSGVKQGCPASMILFVLAFDPILRFIDSRLSPLGCSLFGYCDDLAIACPDLVNAWSIISRIFVLVTRICSLRLNVGKTQIWICVSGRAGFIRDSLRDISPDLNDNVYQDFIKYLGIFLGPGASRVMWGEVISGYSDTISFLHSAIPGLIPTIALYNILAHSKFAYITSYINPPKEVLVLERKSQQLLTRGPRNAFPPKFLLNLKAIGIKLQFSSLELTSVSSRIRNGLISLTNFPDVYNHVQHILRCDERVLRPEHWDWLDRTCIFSIHDAISSSRSLNCDFSGASLSGLSQRKISAALANHFNKFDPAYLFECRLKRFFPSGTHSCMINTIFASYKSMSSSHKPCVVLAHIQTVLNQWNTNRRYGRTQRDCPFFCGFPEDCVEHLITCDSFQASFHRSLGQRAHLLTSSNILLLRSCDSPMQGRFLRYMFLYNFVCLKSFNACRHDGRLSDRLINHFLTVLSGHCSATRADVIFFRSHRNFLSDCVCPVVQI